MAVVLSLHQFLPTIKIFSRSIFTPLVRADTTMQLQMHICIFVLHLLFLGMLSIKFVQTVIRQFKIYKGNKLSAMKRPNGQHH